MMPGSNTASRIHANGTTNARGNLAQLGALGMALGSVLILQTNGCNHLPAVPAGVTPLPFISSLDSK